MHPLFVRWLCCVACTFAVCGALRATAAAGEAEPVPAPSPTPSNGIAWRNIGPSVAGGRVAAVSGTPLDPELFYVGTAGGGVWKSSNGGIDWRPTFDGESTGSIGALTIGAKNKDDVWVGSGEAWPRNDVIAGNGVYHTTDGGQTWKHRGLEGTSQIARIAVDPRDPQRVLVAALGSPFADSDERGVYRTDDGGVSWRKTLFLGRATGASDLAVDPEHPDIVFAGMWQFHRNAWHLTSGGTDDGLYKSVDGGSTWHQVGGNGFPAGPLGRIGLAIAPSDPKRIYAMVESAAGILWRSDDGGDRWTPASANTLINERPFYYSRIVVDPHDENHLFSVSVHLAESTNGGKAWHVSGKRVHGDHHDLWIAANGNVILDGNDGGPAISRDGGHSWDQRFALTTAQVYHIGFDRRKPYGVCAGLQDNGTWCGPSDTGDERGILQRDWLRVAGGDGTWVWPDPLDPTIVLASSGGGDNAGQLTRYATATQTAVDISPYLRDQNVIAPRDLRYRFNWEAPLAFSPFERDTVYYGANVVLRSGDRGSSWQAISPDLTRNIRERQGLSGTPLRLDVTGAETFDTILDIAPSPVVRGLIWVGTDDGNVEVTRDGGATWIGVPIPGVDADARIVCVEPSRAAAGRAYVAVDRHFAGDIRPLVYVTENYGTSWRALGATLDPADFVHVVREDPRNPAVLFAGTEHGVYWTENRGESWSPFPARLPAVSVHDLRVTPEADDLIAGTHGRGVWILDDLRPFEEHAAAITAGTRLFTPRDAQIVHRVTSTTLVRGAGTAPEGPALLTFFQRVPATVQPTIEITDRLGHVVRHLSGFHDVDDESVPVVSNVAGLNRVAWDLTTDAPVAWQRAPKWNRGPLSGIPLVSGTYSVTLHRSGAPALSVSMRISADRRASASDADDGRGIALLTRLYAELSAVDDALNVLDNVRLQMAPRIAAMGTSGDAALIGRMRVVGARADELERTLTSQPENSQDDDFLTDMLRERLVTFVNSLTPATSTAEQLREGNVLLSDGGGILERYRTFAAVQLRPLDRELARDGFGLDLAAKPAADPKPAAAVDERADRRNK